MLKVVISILLAGSLLPSCAKKKSKKNKKDNKFTYQYRENGCDTGRHSFATKAQYCEALLDDSRNRQCARDSREREFRRECGQLPNTFTDRRRGPHGQTNPNQNPDLGAVNYEIHAQATIDTTFREGLATVLLNVVRWRLNESVSFGGGIDLGAAHIVSLRDAAGASCRLSGFSGSLGANGASSLLRFNTAGGPNCRAVSDNLTNVTIDFNGAKGLQTQRNLGTVRLHVSAIQPSR